MTLVRPSSDPPLCHPRCPHPPQHYHHHRHHHHRNEDCHHQHPPAIFEFVITLLSVQIFSQTQISKQFQVLCVQHLNSQYLNLWYRVVLTKTRLTKEQAHFRTKMTGTDDNEDADTTSAEDDDDIGSFQRRCSTQYQPEQLFGSCHLMLSS